MNKTQRSFNSTLRRVSPKREALNREYRLLIRYLRLLCDNLSELTGSRPFYFPNAYVEPHHVGGRDIWLLNPFRIIMLTPWEHSQFTDELELSREYPEERLLSIIRDIRLAQGFLEPCPMHGTLVVKNLKEEVEREIWLNG